MKQNAIRAVFEDLRILAHTDFAAGWTSVGSVLGHDAKWMMFYNLTDKTLLISDVGINPGKLPIAANSFIIVDVSSNRNEMGGTLTFAKGTQYYVKSVTGVNPGSGSFYISMIYGGI